MTDAASRTDLVTLPLAACLVAFAVAASTALLLAPVQARLRRVLGGRSSAAAALVVLACATLLLLLLLTYGALLRAQAAAILESTARFREPGALERWWSRTLAA